ncbi:hypothetical protein HN51_026348 [Arachis hypogaea]
MFDMTQTLHIHFQNNYQKQDDWEVCIVCNGPIRYGRECFPLDAWKRGRKNISATYICYASAFRICLAKKETVLLSQHA